jgi:hypothetical protein
MKRKSFPKQCTNADEVLEVIHTDVCGPMQVESLIRKRYFVTFIDEKSRFVDLYLLRQKCEVCKKFLEFVTLVENQTDKTVKRVHSDNGTEYTSEEFEELCAAKGIVHTTSEPYTPEHNPIAERMNRTLVEMGRSMLHESGLPRKYWGEAVVTAAYIRNRCPTTAVKDMTPFEAWTGKKPNVEHLRPFGCIVYAHIPKEHRKKLDPKGMKCKLLGYGESSGAYRLLDESNRVFISRNVKFVEPLQVSGTGVEGIRAPEWHQDSETEEEPVGMAGVCSIKEPRTMLEALRGPDAEKWRAEGDDEFK